MATPINTISIQEIFPSTKTATINKLITENSITRLLNRLIDVDGYIISSELSVDVSNQYNYVEIDNDLLRSSLEVCIRGYYFNLGTYESIIQAINNIYSDIEVGDVFQISIFIDETNPNYPELYGQDTFSEDIINNEGELGVIEFASGYIPDTIKFYTDEDTQVDIEGFIPGTTTWDDISDRNISYIKYWVRITDNIIWISRTNDEGSDAPKNPSGGDETNLNYIRKDLVLFEAVSGDTTTELKIPMTSFHKFSSISINSIDGGEIK